MRSLQQAAKQTLHTMSFAAVTGRAVRWGVMGTGTIAHDFVKVLQVLPGCEVAARRFHGSMKAKIDLVTRIILVDGTAPTKR